MSSASILAVALALLGASCEASLLTRGGRGKTPISEKVIIGEGPSQFSFVGSDIVYNQCYPYDVAKYGKIKVCGSGTVVKIYLRGRCEAYSHYLEEVGHCTAAVVVDPLSGEGDCMEVSPESNRWLQAAQSYVIEQCGAAQGQANEYEGPACKTMDECTQLAKDQAAAEKEKKMEDAALKAVGAERPR